MLILHREQCFPSHADAAMYAEADGVRSQLSESASNENVVSEASPNGGSAEAVWWYSNAGSRLDVETL